jgi:hypothetical protein
VSGLFWTKIVFWNFLSASEEESASAQFPSGFLFQTHVGKDCLHITLSYSDDLKAM